MYVVNAGYAHGQIVSYDTVSFDSRDVIRCVMTQLRRIRI